MLPHMRHLPSSAVQAAIFGLHQHAAVAAACNLNMLLLLCHFSSPRRLHITSLWLVWLATQYQRTVVMKVFCISHSLHLPNLPHRLLHLLLLLLLRHLFHLCPCLPFSGSILFWLEHNHSPVKFLLPGEPRRWGRGSPGDIPVRPGRKGGEGGDEGIGGGQAPELHL